MFLYRIPFISVARSLSIWVIQFIGFVFLGIFGAKVKKGGKLEILLIEFASLSIWMFAQIEFIGWLEINSLCLL